jgi:beta-glucosidase
MFGKKMVCQLSGEEIVTGARDILARMTLKEKVWLLNGNWNVVRNTLKYKNSYNPVPISTNGCKRLGISPIRFADGPRGVVLGHSTCFPVSMGRGASFDRDLEGRIGDVIGKECRAQGANYFGGVCINLLRHPAWGRAQETYGEDPYHLGEMGVALTRSVQKHNVMACVKHFALNSIENTRFKVNITADERTLREVYLPHFKKCIDAGAASVMGAYNLYNGDHCCESRYLLTNILRDDWGFQGFTLSDFLFGIRNTEKAINAGMDVEMPMPVHYQKELLNAVLEGRVSEETVNCSVERVIKTLMVFENSPDVMEYTKNLVAHEEHRALACEAAEKSMVLIKNENSVLPFSKDAKKILVVGKLAQRAVTGDHGSSRIYAPYVVTILEGLRNYFGNEVEIIHCDEREIETAKREAISADCVIIVAGNDYNDEGEYIMPDEDVDMYDIIKKGYLNQGMPVRGMLVKFLGKFVRKSYTDNDDESSGGDRKSLSLRYDEVRCIREMGRINPNTVTVLVCGSMIMTREWEDSVPAILYGWYPGMEGGNALPRILFGDVSPVGKLPFTIPQDEKHLPYFSVTDREITYDLYHGYTLLEKNDLEAAYPFGFGLTYTTFTISEPVLKKQQDQVEVSTVVKNTGKRDGAQVVQVYVGMKSSRFERQRKLLKGFQKVYLKAGEEKEVVVTVQLEELKVYIADEGSWFFEKGTYVFYVGTSSNDDDATIIEINL